MSMPLHCVSFFGGTCVSYNGTKTMELHVLSHLEFVIITFNSFDLWMSKGNIDTYASSLTISMKVAYIGMLPWGCLKCMKQMAMPWLHNSNFYWKVLN